MRRHFDLPETDVVHLTARGLPWESVVERDVRWLLIHGFAVPAGYDRAQTDLALRIEPGYPDAQLDMAYFCPGLVRSDGRAIGALSSQMIDGRQFQRWSRHRTCANPWRPAEDDLSTHLLLVEDWLRREFSRGVA